VVGADVEPSAPAANVDAMPTVIRLVHAWVLGERLGEGGFAPVFAASSAEVTVPAVIKLIPKEPGAARELLFENLTGICNVVPVIESGETEDAYVLVMERAQQSLRQRLNQGPDFSEEQALVVLADIARSLDGISERGVVHRDLKPDNVLYLNGHWCLSDFGISRYIEASTSENTRKHAKTRQYAAPEQWREQTATPSTDIYALGVMAYELLAGHRPFLGPDFRHEHLHESPPPLAGVSSPVAALVSECLLKDQGSRPSATDVLRRIAAVSGPAPSGGLARLRAASHTELDRRAEMQRKSSETESLIERRGRLYEDARSVFALISAELRDALTQIGTSLTPRPANEATWALKLGKAVLKLGLVHQQAQNPERMPFDVVAYSSLSLLAPGHYGYRGRRHSLWYCDMFDEGRFAWYETAFKGNAFGGPISAIAPDEMRPDAGAEAFAPGVGMHDVAWNPRKLEPGNLADFIERWATWLANAYEGRWVHPTSLPEEQILQNWRR
jgi:serine/threonine protein kinase